MYWPRFLANPQPLIAECLDLGVRAERLASAQTAQIAHIPQPEHVVSSKHNLKSQESFIPLKLPQACEYFPQYGEPGHVLMYLRGNRNIPPIAWSIVDELVSHVPVIAELAASKGKPLNWKMTLNLYKVTQTETQNQIGGFPFHVDIPSNGAVTMILSLRKGARLEMQKGQSEEADFALEIEPNSLLIFSGESRYEWRHRVMPSPVMEKDSQVGDVARISVVFGAQ